MNYCKDCKYLRGNFCNVIDTDIDTDNMNPQDIVIINCSGFVEDDDVLGLEILNPNLFGCNLFEAKNEAE